MAMASKATPSSPTPTATDDWRVCTAEAPGRALGAATASLSLASLPLILTALLCAIGCTTTYDVGETSLEQLCDVVSVAPDDTNPAIRLTPAVEAVANGDGPTTELTAIYASYNTKGDAYDNLGPYEPAVAFLAIAGDPANDVVQAMTPTPAVTQSAADADQALDTDGACE